MTIDWKRFFPFNDPREEQKRAIQFGLDAFLKGKKRFLVIEAGTGVGKSAIGVTIANYINAYLPIGAGYTAGAYVLTTQKLLQEQYLRDFGPGRGSMLSIKSAANYQCEFYRNQTCAESKRVLNSTGKLHADPNFVRCCRQNCPYTRDKAAFIASPLSVTNYSYFMAETMYAGRLEPRSLIISDEAHNLEAELSKFIEVTFSEKFAKDTLKIKCAASMRSPNDVFDWISKSYKPTLAKYIQKVEEQIEEAIVSNNPSFGDLSKQYELLDKHICKVNRFISNYSSDNWIMNVLEAKNEKRGGRRFEFKPIDVSLYSHDILFKFGERHVLMSATIINKDMFCRTLGIKDDEVDFISIESPFPVENRPTHYLPVGKMSAGDIERTLPVMMDILRDILKAHPNEKGIFHAVNYKVVNYLRDNLRDPRLLIQNDENRDAILRKHVESTEPTVLVSPSMTEGVDLRDDLSRFQVFLKMPFPYLGDQVTQKRMKLNEGWYPFVTARTIIQGVGRSIRNETDTAVTYILDSCWEQFYRQNKKLFPPSFQASMK